MKNRLLKIIHSIKENFKYSPFWQNRLISFLFSFSLISNLTLWILIIIKSRHTIIPFYKPISSSITYLIPYSQEIYLLPITGLFIFLINFILAYYLFRTEKFLSYLFLGQSLFIQIILIFTFIFYLIV